jgi:hypothetical protein
VKQFDFPLKDHEQLGRELGMIDVERGVKLAGTRSYFLTGAGALLHQAVLRLAVPYTGLICTARESPQVRREVMAFGVSQINAGSRIELGGYTEAGDAQSVEREQFQKAPAGTAIAAGGGFLALHADLLGEDTAVLVPVSFEKYRERLLQDATRPRLRPELSAEEEVRAVYEEREAIHRALADRVIGLGELLAAAGG